MDFMIKIKREDLSDIFKWLVKNPFRLFLLYPIIILLFFFIYMNLEINSFNFSSGEESWFDFLYFSIITITTLGYGDISPIKFWAKVYVSLEVFIGVSLLALIVHSYGVYTVKSAKQKEKEAHDTQVAPILKKHYETGLKVLFEGLNTFQVIIDPDYKGYNGDSSKEEIKQMREDRLSASKSTIPILKESITIYGMLYDTSTLHDFFNILSTSQSLIYYSIAAQESFAKNSRNTSFSLSKFELDEMFRIADKIFNKYPEFKNQFDFVYVINTIATDKGEFFDAINRAVAFNQGDTNLSIFYNSD